MATDVELPQLGESVTEGTITAWLVEVGDTVEADQPLFELSSDKIDTEVPSPTAGVVSEILVQVDETVEVGTVVARIGSAEDAPASAEDAAASDDGGEAAPAETGSEPEEQPAPAAAEAAAESAPDEPAAESPSDTGGGEAGGGEAVDVILPELGESVTEGTITAWLVAVGDEVSEDDPLFELSSDKIDTEVPSPASGTISEILVQVDETVEVGTVVARIGGGGAGSAQAESADTPAAQPAEAPSAEAPPSPRADAPAAPAAEVLASPLVRRLANDKNVDLSRLSGSGQGGRVTREDVEAAAAGEGAPTQASRPAAATPAAPATPSTPKVAARAAGERERTESLSRIRQRIAEKMLESKREAAQLTTVQEADLTALMAARAAAKTAFAKREGVSLSPFAMIARAAIIAVRDHPLVNAYADWGNGTLYLRDYVNLGIAVDTEKGLLVPNVKNADSLTVGGLARGIADVAAKARGEKKIDFSDIEGGTFTLTNTGSRGVLIDTPILNYPEVAILGVGAIKERPAVVTSPDGGKAIAIRQLLYLSLTYDHRLLDGADAARYVTDVKRVLETTDWAQEIGG